MPEFHASFQDQELAQALLPYAFDAQDGAHDQAHLLRVWQNVSTIAEVEGGDKAVLQAATILHDCVWVAKDAPERANASTLAAKKARLVLEQIHWTGAEIAKVM
ncbi:MAG: HD domain-containing protein [Pseudomonadota bacterium]